MQRHRSFPAGREPGPGPSRSGLLLTLTAFLAACASTPYQPAALDPDGFIARAERQEDDTVTVRAAVPDAEETLELTGIDLYEQGIQPLWIEVSNRGRNPLRVSMWSIDRNYFSPIEVAYMNRKRFSGASYPAMERWFNDNALTRRIPPGETRSGFVYTNYVRGTKGFNIDLMTHQRAHTFTFFLPLPGFQPDYMTVDFANLYDPGEVVQLSDLPALATFLSEDLPCCADDPDGNPTGGPLNLILIGNPVALRRSLLRGGWLETSSEEKAEIETRQHHFQGRTPDGRFFLVRADGEEHLMLNIWLAPWTFAGETMWVVQAFYRHKISELAKLLRNGGALVQNPLFASFVEQSVSADIDSAQQFVVQNLWYSQSVRKLGFLPGVGAKDMEEPGVTFDGLGYFTAGRRAVLFLSTTPTTMGDADIVFQETANATDQAATP